MGPPFSACIMMRAPLSAARCMARKIEASSSMKTPGYAMKSLKEVIPSPTSSSISFRTPSLTSLTIMWSPKSVWAFCPFSNQRSSPCRSDSP
jgi:hypothetical protein